jgi:hypothetical protein
VRSRAAFNYDQYLEVESAGYKIKYHYLLVLVASGANKK